LLRHEKAELDALAPEGDEEDRLAARRTLLQNAERLGEAIKDAAREIGGENDGDGGAQRALARALRRLERTRDRAQGLLDNAVAAAERAAAETAEALEALSGAAARSNSTRARSNRSRSASLRCAPSPRKHGITVADLPRLLDSLATRVAAIETGAEDVIALERAASVARDRLYRGSHPRIAGSGTRGAPARWRNRRRAEPLRLDKARFRTVLTALARPNGASMAASACISRSPPTRGRRSARWRGSLGRRAVAASCWP